LRDTENEAHCALRAPNQRARCFPPSLASPSRGIMHLTYRTTTPSIGADIANVTGEITPEMIERGIRFMEERGIALLTPEVTYPSFIEDFLISVRVGGARRNSRARSTMSSKSFRRSES
jgi:hypothetical protein